MNAKNSDVPEDVEQLLISVMANAGQLGGHVGGGVSAASGGARGAAWTAKRMKTVVEDRAGTTSARTDGLLARIRQEFAGALTLETDNELTRVVIPIGSTGLQQIIVDVRLGAEGEASVSTTRTFNVRAFGKEGLLSRKPTARTADTVARLLQH